MLVPSGAAVNQINSISKHYWTSRICEYYLLFAVTTKLQNILKIRTPTVQKHLANVYTCLLISAASAAAGVYLSMTGWLNFPILAFFGSLITSIWLGLTELNAATQRTCFALLSVNALFIGIYISPLISLAVQIDPQIVMTAVMAASLIFACFSLSALYAKRRTYLYLGGM